MTKVVVVGGVAGGGSAAARIRRLDESAEIVIYERGSFVSFSNCCLPYYLSRTVENIDDLVMMSVDQYRNQYNINVHTNTEVTSIDREKRTVTIHDLVTNEMREDNYDVLILSTGAAPILPASIKGIDRLNVFTIRNVDDIGRLDHYVMETKSHNIAIVGGGFIGCEVAENLKKGDRCVSIIEAQNQIMSNFDFDMVQILHKEMLDNGVRLVLGDGLKEITDGYCVTQSGKQVPADVVVMAIGVRPETTLAKNAGLEIGETGGIKVNHNFQTSDPSIYAVGDAIEEFNELTGKPGRIALAWPAQMEARKAADAIYGKPDHRTGFIGSSVVRIFTKYAASTGLNETNAKKAGISYDFVYVIPQDKVGIMPDSEPIHLKLLFEVPTGRILGAQAIGDHDADRRIDVIATLIHMGGTLEDLRDVELCYAPVVSTAKDAVHMAALVGLNVLNGVFRQVKVSDVRGLVENNAYIIDVREKGEYARGHIIGSHNIPLSELRSRVNEIPKERPVYLHCRSSQRSYNALMALQNLGFDNVYNISGSFLGLSLYEYGQTEIYGKEPILTEYNFN
ncbi:FAD-dependent oxidoreductase [Galactobacillus timonensis]|uniref:FAD-dependent oxidoreductase n=1 Tax=Galactobacillus timonensis TaxID=2041840 RepID=UPI000C831B75|nr:FAD-dependent oxidoreductase [Galactobacillus timonensis]